MQNIKTLLERQDAEKINIREVLEQQVCKETRESLNKEALIVEAKTVVYEKCWIEEKEERNSKPKQFLKWIVDLLIIDNDDLAIEIYETNGKVIIEALKQLMSWEWIKQMAKAIGESIMNLFTWNAYEKWKAVWELGLVWTGIWVTAVLWKKAIKVWMKEIAKRRNKKEHSVWDPEMKEVILDTRSKIDEIIPKQELDVEKILAENLAKLWDIDRMKAGANHNEIRTIMEKWSWKKERLSGWWTSLLDKPEFRFLNNPEYKELLDLYWWNIDIEKLLWEWQNAIILQHPHKWNRVLKIAKEWARDDIIQEFDNHQKFYETLEQWRIDFPWQLGENVKIPVVRKGNWKNPIYFEMERIHWQSFKSLFYREKYASQLEKIYSQEELRKISDAKLERVVEELWWDIIPRIIVAWDGWFSKALFNESQAFMWNKIRDPLKKQEYELWNTLSFLDWKWLKHTDMHSWNFMVSRDWKTTYIIDFWNTNLDPNK